MSRLTHADECERVITVLGDTISTLEEIATLAKMPHWRANEIVLDLRLKGQVEMSTVRVKGRKVTHYTLKRKA